MIIGTIKFANIRLLLDKFWNMPLLFIYVVGHSGLGAFHKIVEKEKYFPGD